VHSTPPSALLRVTATDHPARSPFLSIGHSGPAQVAIRPRSDLDPASIRAEGASGYAWTMCGRYLLFSDPEQLAERFEVDEIRTDSLEKRYNVAPSTSVYAVLDDGRSRRLGTLRWGFVPHWAKQLKGTPQPINARIETVATSRMFAPSFARKRCLLPADGFYEWQDRGKGARKQPFHLADPSGEPLAFAGIWSSWRDPQQPDDDPLFSAAIMTTDARGEMERIHHRMPVILPRTLWQDWLTADADDAPHLLEAITALGPPRLDATPISDRVNAVRNDGPELLEPGSVEE
jgi:putative SOS response-associated peptidase YedK